MSPFLSLLRQLGHHTARLLALLLISISIGAATGSAAATPSGTDVPLFSASGTLNDGDVIAPNYVVSSGPLDFLFRMEVTGAGDVDLTITGSDNGVVWDDTVQGGEVVWGYGMLPAGNTTLTLGNNSAASADYDLKLFAAQSAPHSFSGSSAPDGHSSAVELTFPQSGLYTFDLGVSAGRYQVRVADGYIRKVVEATESVTLFVPAGTHEIAIFQDSIAGANWSLAVSSAGAAADSLPYEQQGGLLGGSDNDFDTEMLPIHLDAAATVNVALAVVGDSSDLLWFEVGSDTRTFVPAGDSAAGGETVWMTLDLPAGTSFLQLYAAGNSGALAYDLTVNAVPTPPADWSGASAPDGQNSQWTFSVATAGIYEFDLGLAGGRYQLQVNENYLQKTVEEPETVQFFLPAGNHSMTIRQDSTAGAIWSVGVTQVSSGNDTLPYAHDGGMLGGPANDFDEAWLPVAVDGPVTLNMKVAVAGTGDDSLQIELFNSATVTTPNVILDPVLGTETVWISVELSGGINRIHLSADDANGGPLAYDLSLNAVPTASGPVAWSGSVQDVGQNPTFTIDFPANGTYRFRMETSSGFATMAIDDAPLARGLASTAQWYEIDVTNGTHLVRVEQDPAFPVTAWSASVAPVTAGEAFFTFSGTVPAGATVAPNYPQDAGNLDFNLVVSSDGADLDVELQDGGGSVLWGGTILDGETVWHSATLPSGDNRMELTNNSGTDAEVEITFYEVPEAPYSWAGVAAPAGEESQVRVQFPTDGLYTFDLGGADGRYQLEVAEGHIRKTVEMTETVTLFVPAGTHSIVIDQDGDDGADWNVAISAVGAGADTLPYVQMGGILGGPTNDFDIARLPIYLDQPTAVNMSVSVTGDPEPLNVTLGAPAKLDIPGGFVVLGGETRWQSVDLPAGVSYLHLDAGAAASGLAYEVTLSALPEPAITWSGTADADGGDNQFRMSFPSDGLYTFNLAGTSDDIALALDENYLRKLAVGGDAPEMTVFVPAGTHALHLMHAGQADTAWSVDVSAMGAPADTLPYVQSSMALKPEAGFDEEWFPFFSGEAESVNVRIDVTGDASDALYLELFDGLSVVTPTMMVGPVYGGESTWFTVDLPTDGARMRVVANGGNVADLGYEITVDGVPAITGTTQDSFAWDGVATDAAINAAVRIDTAVSGNYHVEMVMPDGFAAIYVDSAPLVALEDTIVAFDVYLDAGEHAFIVDPSGSFPSTVWSVTVSLLEADAPEVTSTDPVSATDEVATPITIYGVNFMPGATVALVDGSDTYPLLSVTYESATELSAMVPAGLPLATYDVVVINPDSRSGNLPGSFTVFRQTFYSYLPVVTRP